MKEKIMRIAVHASVFHADDVFVVAFFKMWANFIGASLKITRLFKVEEDWDIFSTDPFKGIVADIGGGTFDHHGGENENELYHHEGTPMAAFGKVWLYFGEMFMMSLYPELDATQIANMVENSLIIGISAVDNGVIREKADPQVKNIAAIINDFRPTWDSEESMDEAFNRAVDFAIGVLERSIQQAAARVKAETIVDEAFANAEKGIAIFEKGVPWKGYVLSGKKGENIFYVISPSHRGGFNCESVPVTGDKFTQKKPFPESWRGKRDVDLAQASGVADAIFCHNSGHLVVAHTLESAKKLAELSSAEWDAQQDK